MGRCFANSRISSGCVRSEEKRLKGRVEVCWMAGGKGDRGVGRRADGGGKEGVVADRGVKRRRLKGEVGVVTSRFWLESRSGQEL